MKLKKLHTLKKKEKTARGVKGLMEGIILQAISDLWTTEETDDCIKFFSGDRFRVCADMAGINLHDQVKLLDLVHRIVDLRTADITRQKKSGRKEEVFTPAMSGRRQVKFSAAAGSHSPRRVCAL